MFRSALIAAPWLATAAALPVLADSTEAYCWLSRHDHTAPVEQSRCQFSQRQGNVTVDMGSRWAFRFDSEDQGKSYTRDNLADGIRFSREGEYTLTVFWSPPQ